MSIAVSPLAIYIALGVVFAWFVQMKRARIHSTNWRERMWSSVTCSFLTVSISLPLLDTFPQLPQSITLLIGCIVGAMGLDGVLRLLSDVLNLRFGFNLNGISTKSDKPSNHSKTNTNQNNNEVNNDNHEAK